MTKDIEELFEDKADEAGFCLDKKWGDYKNPYLDSNTSLAFDFFRSGFLTAENFEKQKLEGCVVVPVQCPDPDFADSLFDELSKKAIGGFDDDLLIHFSNIDEEKIWALMVEAAKAQAVPEGFVLVNKKDLVKVLNCVTDDWLVDTDSFEEFKKIESLVQDEVNAMIEAQRLSHE